MQRVLALDVGDRRIGLAVSDALGITAQGIETYTRTGDLEKDAAYIRSVAEKYRPVRLLFGMPRNMDGSEGESAQNARAFGAELAEKTGLPVDFSDERGTTITAHGFLNETNTRGKRRKATVDAVAATIILQDYLDYRRNRKG